MTDSLQISDRLPGVESLIANSAREFALQLFERVTAFDGMLKETHGVGIRLVSFGQTIVFRLENISYRSPSLIILSGRTEDDEPIELVQHMTQVSILLTKVPRLNPTFPKLPVGFRAPREERAGA